MVQLMERLRVRMTAPRATRVSRVALLAALFLQQVAAFVYAPCLSGLRPHNAGVAEVCRAGGGELEPDPFRPERASIDPIVINTLKNVIFEGANAQDAVAETIDTRAETGEWQLSEEEAESVRGRVCGVAASLAELRFMLAAAVKRNSFITKYGMESDYGVGEDLESNPLTQLNHVEALLALYMLHKEGSGAAVNFVDGEKLQVLGG